MKKAVQCGLVFSEEAMEKYRYIDPKDALGQAHDEWKMVPWGIPEHRVIPDYAVMANTVQMRLSAMPEYRPENLSVTDGGMLKGYGVEDILSDA